MIRDRIWSKLITTKYQAIYITIYGKRIRNYNTCLNAFVAIFTSVSVGGWVIWKDLPYIWAPLIGLCQIINVVRPHIAFLKNTKALSEASLFYETIHVDLGELWLDIEAEAIDENAARVKFTGITRKELKITALLQEISVPNIRSLENMAEKQWERYLLSEYNVNLN